jgi:diguanylate cyclase (GGDEF)-like protein
LALVRQLADQAKSQQTSRLRVEFDSARKEQENRELNAENQLRSQALASAQAIQRLQLTALALGTVALLALAALGLRQRSHARRMRTLAMTDELTRLPNRRHLMMLAEAQLAAAQASGAPLAVLALDIDHFKQVNDQHGHDAGDQVLRRVASAALAALRRNDVLGRTGGEEFVALLPGASPEMALEAAERMRAAVAGLRLDDIAAGLRASISLGLSPRRQGERSLGPVLKRADAALYRAKQAGRNRVMVSD